MTTNEKHWLDYETGRQLARSSTRDRMKRINYPAGVLAAQARSLRDLVHMAIDGYDVAEELRQRYGFIRDQAARLGRVAMGAIEAHRDAGSLKRMGEVTASSSAERIEAPEDVMIPVLRPRWAPELAVGQKEAREG